ncbi:MAG TPA: aminotransferase class III-fold pyridoxal phosphate-dependent enzyme [Polyangia bacterium]|nr:aminotransferase class III-fold pyridoxal phosphate-dependent enzyme [Polyangia bacterium]
MSAADDLAGRHRANVLYTWTAQRDAVPMEIVSGRGARFQTADGASWIDFGSMVWNAALGHGHEGMKRALVSAAERGLVALPSSVFADKARAAELLLEVAPAGLRGGKAFLCLSGAEANENAVKMARLATGKRKIVYRSRSYHGATLAMLSLSGDPRRAPFDPGLPGGVPWNDPYSADPGAGDLERVLAREDPQTVAAVLLEGVVGANGVYVPPPGYWKRVREVCDRHRVLLIVDEVLSGFGRTGRWFAIDHDEVSPDILTCAKGLTAGYAPGGAVVIGPALAQHFEDHVLSCGLTAYAHPLTCAAIVAAIEAYRREGLVERAERLGDELEVQLRTLAETRPYVREVRGVGLLWALELDARAAQTKQLAEELRARHLHLHKRDTMVFVAPPLVIDEADLRAGVTALGQALDAVWSPR